MLITRSPFFEEQTHLPEGTSPSDALLKRLDVVLDDDDLLEQVRADLARRYRLTTRHGRHSTPVEVILRLLVLKDLFNWGFHQTEAQVARTPMRLWFCRVEAAHVPDHTTLMRWSRLIRASNDAADDPTGGWRASPLQEEPQDAHCVSCRPA